MSLLTNCLEALEVDKLQREHAGHTSLLLHSRGRQAVLPFSCSLPPLSYQAPRGKGPLPYGLQIVDTTASQDISWSYIILHDLDPSPKGAHHLCHYTSNHEMAHDDGRSAIDDELIARLLSEDQAHVDPFEDADDSQESTDSRDAPRKRRKKKRGDLLPPPNTHLAKGQFCACVRIHHGVWCFRQPKEHGNNSEGHHSGTR